MSDDYVPLEAREPQNMAKTYVIPGARIMLHFARLAAEKKETKS